MNITGFNVYASQTRAAFGSRTRNLLEETDQIKQQRASDVQAWQAEQQRSAVAQKREQRAKRIHTTAEDARNPESKLRKMLDKVYVEERQITGLDILRALHKLQDHDSESDGSLVSKILLPEEKESGEAAVKDLCSFGLILRTGHVAELGVVVLQTLPE